MYRFILCRHSQHLVIFCFQIFNKDNIPVQVFIHVECLILLLYGDRYSALQLVGSARLSALKL
jgi:hypothetical protein